MQVDEARALAAKKGWSISEQHLYLEDAVSRAEFVKRPALLAMLRDAKEGDFDVIVLRVRDVSRLGGDMVRTVDWIQKFIDLGVSVHLYYQDEMVQMGNAVQRMMMLFRSFTAEAEREKISERTHEHLLHKTRRGFVAGGVVFGYDNVRLDDGVVRKVNESQAEIVRGIFSTYADGAGLKAIARKLNDRGVPPPSAARRGTQSWSPSCIRAMLRNELYVGIQVWNRTKKVYRGGTKKRVNRPESEWLRIPLPDLRIVDEHTWQAVESIHRKNQRLGGRRGSPVRYMLSGIAKCGTCGGPMHATNRRLGGETIKMYTCSHHRNRGNMVCTNTLGRPVAQMDGAVLASIGKVVLNRGLFDRIIETVAKRLSHVDESRGSEMAARRKQIEMLEREVGNMVNAVAASGGSAALLAGLAKKEGELDCAKRELAEYTAAAPLDDLQVGRMRKAARDRLDDLAAMMTRNPLEARKVLESVLQGPIVCDPQQNPKRYIMKAPLGLPEGLFGRSEVHYSGVPSGV